MVRGYSNCSVDFGSFEKRGGGTDDMAGDVVPLSNECGGI